VQQQRAREAEPVVALAVPEQEARDGEQHRERRGQRRVQLLARVELADAYAPVAAVTRAQPLPVGGQEAVQPTGIVAKGA
jgi:hypothetical protein